MNTRRLFGFLYRGIGVYFTIVILPAVCSYTAYSATFQVRIAESDESHFIPKFFSIHAGDTVQWIWADNKDHSVVSGQGNGQKPNGIFNSGIHRAPFTYSYTFHNTGTYPYYCGVHAPLNQGGTFPIITVTAATSTPAILSNISTRLRVESGDNALIGGFIVGGTGPKQLLLRALGPTLSQFGVTGVLANPKLELHNSSGALLAFNDNWGAAANAQSIPTTLRPPNTLESAIFTSLNPGSYTAVVRGVNNTTGQALVEAYDTAPEASSHLTNISTRGFVQTGSNVMIAGMIVQGSNQKVIVRALGLTLAGFGVTNALSDPVLELHDANGTLLSFNDNWKSTQSAEIIATGKAPPNDFESAIVRTLTPANYTAVVRGVNNTTGVALVEVYTLP